MSSNEAAPSGDYAHIEDVDDAITAILGYERIASRVLSLDTAAAAAFFSNRPEDEHTAVVRKAYKDLCATGCFQPSVSWQRGVADAIY